MPEQVESPKAPNGEAAQANQGNDGNWTIYDHPVENLRPIRVVVVGAGFSGIWHGIRIPERIRNCDLVIYDKNAGIGGTWYENRFPGAACDVPSHSYQYSFNPKHDWSSLYAPRNEILDYLESTAKKYGADRLVKLRHEVKGCSWNQGTGKWEVDIKDADGNNFVDVCDIVISARGYLNTKKWPDIEGLSEFRGALMHSAEWNDSYDMVGKRIGIIGSGSSAIQIVPKLQRVTGTKLRCFIRSPTWISPPFAQDVQDEVGMHDVVTFSSDQLDSFRRDSKASLDFRVKVHSAANRIHATTLRGSEAQITMQRYIESVMVERLKKKPEYIAWLKPGFPPGCRRLTPGPGFLEALTENNVELVRDEIERAQANGVTTADGTHYELDALICATGFQAGAAPPFPIIGQNGESMQDHWCDRPTNYLSVATDKFPNFFLMLGPNSLIAEGSLTMMMESAGDYILKAIRKIQKDNIKSMVIKPARVNGFLNYCDRYFKDTVFTDECSGWYRKNSKGKVGDKVTGLWPGSALHCLEVLRSPRWEDFEYEYISESNGAEVNPLAWLGNGWTVSQLKEKPQAVDLAFYVMPMFQEREIGIPVYPYPEANEQVRIRPWSY